MEVPQSTSSCKPDFLCELLKQRSQIKHLLSFTDSQLKSTAAYSPHSLPPLNPKSHNSHQQIHSAALAKFRTAESMTTQDTNKPFLADN